MTLDDVVRSMQEKFGDGIAATADFRGERTVTVTKPALEPVLEHCRDHLAFDYLVDLSTVDNIGLDPRFEVVYELYSYESHLHLRVKAATSEDDPEFPTVSHLWATANWHEREAWDMMGIRFTGHPNLTRILMWEGYPYFPLRKEFPLAGKPSEMPDVAFSAPAPLAGGPFVTNPGAAGVVDREPRAHPAE